MNKIPAHSLVERCLLAAGIDPLQFATLVTLFSKLRERDEFEMGAARVGPAILIGFFTVFSALVNLIVVAVGKVTIAQFVGGNYVFTVFLLLPVLAAQAMNTFLNPVEAAALAHLPIREKCYFAAKLTYLLVATAFIVFPINLVPALAGLSLKGARWFYPVVYLACAYGLGIFVALFECGVLGILFKVIPAARVRNVVLWLQVALFTLMMVGPQLARKLPAKIFTVVSDYSSAIPLTWFVALVTFRNPAAAMTLQWPAIPAMLLCAVVMYFGISSLTHGYMSSVQTMLRSGTGTSSKSGSWFGSAIRLVTGRPSGRAAFAFTYRMAKTDWQFRHTVYPMLIQLMILPVGVLAHVGVRRSPFQPGPPSLAHFLPHLCGLAGLLVCNMITYSNQHRGAWIFLMAPFEGIRSFVEGIYWALWLPLFSLTILATPVLAWYWGPVDAVLFAAYSLAVASFYLSWELFLIDGLPFANPPRFGKGSMMAPLVIAALIGAMILVLLQWLFIFQSRFVTAGATFAFAGAAYVVTRTSFRYLEVNVSHNLHVIASGRTAMFAEI